jgi:hypothetical protein
MGELETMQQNDKEVVRQAISKRTKKKIKATVYLTEEAEEAFTELYIHRLRKIVRLIAR